MATLGHLAFTDGACSGNPGPGGWGAIVRDASGTVIELGGGNRRTTNNAMELTGAIEALRYLSNKPGPVVIRTDSTYVIKGISGWVHRWRANGWKTAEGNPVLNQELWEELFRLASARRSEGAIQWEYVRGHQGIPGNERADEIATRFAQGGTPTLFRGPAAAYSVDLDQELPNGGKVPERSKSSSKSKAGHYLSLVGGKALRHKTWTSCEGRVKGTSGAKFKKVTSAEEEQQVLRGWGIDPRSVTDAEG